MLGLPKKGPFLGRNRRFLPRVFRRFEVMCDDVVTEGLAYGWPFMIGKVEVLDISQKEIEINDFWVFETPADRTKPLMERQVPDEGLRPGYDGALLTGDNGLYHVRFRCGYKIRSGTDQLTEGVHPAIQYKLNVSDAPEMIRSVICRAAIRAAAHRTVNGLHSNRGDFTDEVTALAQEQLDELKSGMRIVNISVTDASWPLQTLGDFAAADAARRRNRAVLKQARGQAGQILGAIASNTYKQLVGDPIDGKPKDPNDKEEYDLIGQYARARTKGDGGNNAESEAILLKIDQTLAKTEGSARELIKAAATESSGFNAATQRRYKRFAELLPKYKENPEFMLTAEWTKVLSEIFSSPTVEIVVVGAGKQKINIQTKQNPDIAARIVREMAKIKSNPNAAQHP